MQLTEYLLTKQPLVVIIGPTAVGKTTSAIYLAQQLQTEIINVDSRQIYQEMDIGTAKPTTAEQGQAIHHLIDVVPPDVGYNITDFKVDAGRLIADLHHQRKLPILAGGTGQWLTALLEGWQIPEVSPNPELRAELEAYAEAHGWQGLLERLREHDPMHAERVDPKNLRRVIRALEVCIETGRPYSDFRKKDPPPYTILELGLTLEREILYERADLRINKMVEAGLINEVERLMEKGYAWNLPSMTSLGYLQIGKYLRGEISLDTALEELCFATHHFIRRQYTWFRKHNKNAVWFTSDETAAQQMNQTINNWLLKQSE